MEREGRTADGFDGGESLERRRVLPDPRGFGIGVLEIDDEQGSLDHTRSIDQPAPGLLPPVARPRPALFVEASLEHTLEPDVVRVRSRRPHQRFSSTTSKTTTKAASTSTSATSRIVTSSGRRAMRASAFDGLSLR